MIELPPGLHGAHRRADLVRRLGRTELRSLLATGRLVAFSRAVLVDRYRMLDLPTRAAAALLLCGPRSALCSYTAAQVHGCTAATTGTIHVVDGYERQVHNRPGFAFHQSLVDQQDVLVLDGLRTLALEVVVADLLCRADRGTALAIADQALAMLEPALRAEFKAELAHRLRARRDPRGRRRAALLLHLASGLVESPGESRLLLTLVDAGLPLPQPQFVIRELDGGERYRLDFAWSEPKIGMEYDGYEAHVQRRQSDALRDQDLARRGWIVIRAEAADLKDPDRLITQVRAAFARRRYAA